MADRDELPRCPFSRYDDAALRLCPGYAAERVPALSLIWFPSPLPAAVTCRHLDHQHGARGFVSACTFPGGLPEGVAAAVELLGRAVRRPHSSRHTGAPRAHPDAG